jgi:SAM-dependent methyltransferase
VIAAPALQRREQPSRLGAEQLYGRLLATAVNHVFGDGPAPPRANMRSEDGRTERLPIERWVEPVDAGDTEILAGLAGPVLDIGCAKGYLVYLLRQRGVEAFGVDWSQYAIGTASPDVVPFLREASAYDLPYPDRHFALAVSFDVLEHLDGSHARRALVESARVSHRQLHQINTGRLDEWAFDGDPSHCTKLTLAQWQAMAANANLTGATICEPDRRLPFLEGIVQ